MQMKYGKKVSSFILCMVLIVAMALFTTGCSGTTNKDVSSGTETKEIIESSQASDTVLGTGKTEFAFTVTDEDGNETKFQIHTDKEMVGEALTELGLIAGEESEYGLYVKTVNGITVDYDKDGKYWAFYVNGEYAQTGVSDTAVTEGDTYSFCIEK